MKSSSEPNYFLSTDTHQLKQELQPRKASAKSNFGIFGIQYQYCQLSAYMYTKGIPAEIQIPKQRNFLEDNVTISLLVFSPSNILPQRPTHWHVITPRKYYRAFLLFLKSYKYEIAQL